MVLGLILWCLIMPDSPKELNLLLKKRDYYDHIICVRAFSKFLLKDKLVKFIFTLIHPLPLGFYYNKLEGLYKKSNFNNSKSSHFFYRISKKSYFHKHYFDDYTTLKFCDKEFMVTNDYLSMLIEWYGHDYMTPPPVDERKQTHDILKIGF